MTKSVFSLAIAFFIAAKIIVYFDSQERSRVTTVVVEDIDPIVVTQVEPTKDLQLEKDLYCLAQNVYHEARGESVEGMYAVMDVVMNRVKDENFPNDPCGVVFDAKYSEWHIANTGRYVPLRNECAFSWYCDGKPDTITDEIAWKISYQVAKNYLVDGVHKDISNGATFYHADHVQPFWSVVFKQTAYIDNHIFYTPK